MPCNFPIQAYKCEDGTIIFDERKGNVQQIIKLPCGRCLACRLENARQWAVRCVHEASLYEENCFITLTYNDAHIPINDELDYRDFQLFMKRLRKKYKGKKIRFFACGEYGENRYRPHYHACIFNHNFNDRVYFKKSASGEKIYTSKTLNDLWTDAEGDSIGFSTIGDVTLNSAGYVARYVTKKAYGHANADQYKVTDLETGKTYERQREFLRMSLKPGIGSGWFDKWIKDVFPQDICVVDGLPGKPPKYYYRKLKLINPEMYGTVSENRQDRAVKNKLDNIQSRLEVKEKVLQARTASLKRNLK